MDIKKSLKQKVKRVLQGLNIIKENKEYKYRILLLTNRDSDNVGDQVIEACNISLISAVMKNLNIRNDEYIINSRAASIISQKYLETKNIELLDTANKLIKESDIVIFGGAPVFNFRYQTFYERTAITLEIAQKYNKPVIFSAVGVEGYDEESKKCQRLKKTLNFDCVKQITTRDDFEALQKFIENKNIVIDKVSDPAVFATQVFDDFKKAKKATENTKERKKKIGIFILRANGFIDNGVKFSREDAADLWEKLVHRLEDIGYDYDLLTSGHFGDEAFLDLLIRKYNFDSAKCIFNVNSPEILIDKISSYDAVISCRLHPSIISFSLDVPSIGLVWNPKVHYFYDSIGYGDRVLNVDGITAEKLVEQIEQIVDQGVNKDEDYLMSVYNSLFKGMKNILRGEDYNVEPYNYAKLIDSIPKYKGTTKKELEEKQKRKFRRTYGKYNELFDKKIQNQMKINQLKKQLEELCDEKNASK